VHLVGPISLFIDPNASYFKNVVGL
jgi:hypothetical protein